MGEDSKQKEPELSDWINYLGNIQNCGYVIIGIIFTILVVYYGYIISQGLPILNNIALNISLIILMIALYFFVFSKKSPLNKAKNILHLIMKRELNDIREIEKLWFDKKRDNMEYAKDNIIEIRNKISKFIMGCFIIALVISLYSIFHPLLYDMLGIIKNGVSLVSLGIGSFGISFVIYSLKTSYDSDTKMIQNANVNFLQALDDSLESRIRYIGIPNHNNDSFSWLLQTHFERAYELDRKMIKKKYHHRLIHSFIKSLDVFFNRVEWNDLDTGIQGNIHSVYKIAHHYVRRDKEQEDEFIEILEKMGKKKKESEEEFYHRLSPND